MMMRTFLRSKIHRATVTAAILDEQDAITIDVHLMNAAGLLPFEKVEVDNVKNGSRFETYVLEGRAGSGEIRVSGSAAHSAKAGDEVSIACYAQLHEGQILTHRPKLVFVGAENRIQSLSEREIGSPTSV